MKSVKKSMKRKWLKGEVLCLFFIICLAVFGGKIIINIRDSIGLTLSEISVKNEDVDHQVYSHKMLKSVEGLNEVTIISSLDDLDEFKDKLEEDEIEINWLNEKVKKYDGDEEYFEENSIIILCIQYNSNVSLIRINDLYKSNNRIIVEIKEKVTDEEEEDIYTWFSFIEVKDKTTDVDLEIVES